MAIEIDYERIARKTSNEFASEIEKVIEQELNEFEENKIVFVHVEEGAGILYSVVIMFLYKFVIANFFDYEHRNSIDIKRISLRDYELMQIAKEVGVI